MRKWGKAASWILAASLLCSQMAPVTAQTDAFLSEGNAVETTTGDTVSGNFVDTASESTLENNVHGTMETEGAVGGDTTLTGQSTTVSSGNAEATTYIENNEKGIPDAKLYQDMLINGDGNGDGLLSVAEAKAISSLNLNKAIQDYTGLAFAENVQNLS